MTMFHKIENIKKEGDIIKKKMESKSMITKMKKKYPLCGLTSDLWYQKKKSAT